MLKHTLLVPLLNLLKTHIDSMAFDGNSYKDLRLDGLSLVPVRWGRTVKPNFFHLKFDGQKIEFQTPLVCCEKGLELLEYNGPPEYRLYLKFDPDNIGEHRQFMDWIHALESHVRSVTPNDASYVWHSLLQDTCMKVKVVVNKQAKQPMYYPMIEEVDATNNVSQRGWRVGDGSLLVPPAMNRFKFELNQYWKMEHRGIRGISVKLTRVCPPPSRI